jgi:hypothetical protein
MLVPPPSVILSVASRAGSAPTATRHVGRPSSVVDAVALAHGQTLVIPSRVSQSELVPYWAGPDVGLVGWRPEARIGASIVMVIIAID